MTIDYLRSIADDSARFADVLTTVDEQAPVPTCPDWTAADLAYHLAEVQTFWAGIVGQRLLDEPDGPGPDRPATLAGTLELQRTAAAALDAALAGAEPGEPVWTWADDAADRSVAFVLRRQAHEALVHRWDAEATAGGEVRPTDPTLAADGVSEALTVMFGGAPPWATTTFDGPVGVLRATDTGDAWWVRIGRFNGVGPESGRQFTDEPTLEVLPASDPAAADAAESGPAFEVLGTARDLDAWLWGRPTLAEVTAGGPELGRLTAVVEQGIS